MTALVTASSPAQVLADAVRYRLLLRTLPVVRHEILGPLSVARMGLTVLQRGAQGSDIDALLLQSRLADLKQHLAATAAAVTDLRVLDRDTTDGLPDERLTRLWRSVVTALALIGGHRLEWGEGIDACMAAAPGSAWELLATAVAHAVDCAEAPCALHLTAEDTTVVIRRQSVSGTRVDASALGIIPAQRFDADDLRHLADDVGTACSIVAGDPWELRLSFGAAPVDRFVHGAPLDPAR